MSTDLVPVDYTAELDRMADPAAFTDEAVAWAKEWLAAAVERRDIDAIVQFYRRAGASEVEVEALAPSSAMALNASEIARRSERALGLVIRAGQREGWIALDEDDESDQRCLVYWHYDDRGELLYVGISDRPNVRGNEHAIHSAWVQFAVTMVGFWYPSRAAAEKREQEAIREDKPIFNIVHAVGDPRARIVDYLKSRYARSSRSATAA